MHIGQSLCARCSAATAALMIEFDAKKKCLALEAAWRMRRRRRRSNSSEEKPSRPQLDYVSNHLLCAEQRWLSVLCERVCVCVENRSLQTQWQQQQALIHLFQWFEPGLVVRPRAPRQPLGYTTSLTWNIATAAPAPSRSMHTLCGFFCIDVINFEHTFSSDPTI